MVAYFRKSKDGKLYFVFCGDLVKEESKGLKFSKIFKSGKNKHLNPQPVKVRGEYRTVFDVKQTLLNIHRPDILCLMCLKRKIAPDFIQVDNKFIVSLYKKHRSKFRRILISEQEKAPIKGYLERINEEEIDYFTEEDCIPNFFKNKHRGLTLEHWKGIKANPDFLSKFNSLCLGCYVIGDNIQLKESNSLRRSLITRLDQSELLRAKKANKEQQKTRTVRKLTFSRSNLNENTLCRSNLNENTLCRSNLSSRRTRSIGIANTSQIFERRTASSIINRGVKVIEGRQKLKMSFTKREKSASQTGSTVLLTSSRISGMGWKKRSLPSKTYRQYIYSNHIKGVNC